MVLTSWLLCLCVLQGSDLERLVADLGADEIARRDEAERLLRREGERALPLLEAALRSGTAEVVMRAERVSTLIRDDATLRADLGPARSLRITVREMEFRKALALVDRQAGFETRISDDVEDRKVTLSVEDSPYLEVLDLLCGAHGAARLDVRPHRNRASKVAFVEIVAGKTVIKPTVYPGPFRVRVEEIRLHRPKGPSIRFSTIWQPNVRPFNGTNIILERGLDNRGVDVVTPKVKRDNTRYRGTSSSARARAEPHRSWFTYRELLPAEEATHWTHLEGSVVMTFSLKQPVFEFTPDQVGARRAVGEYFLEFTELAVREKYAKVTFTCVRRDGVPFRSAGLAPIDSSSIEMLDGQGRKFRWSSRGGGLKDGSNTVNANFKIEGGRTPARVRVKALLRAHRYEVPFKFRDVPLPRW